LNDLGYPAGVAINDNGTLWVSAQNDCIIRRFDSILTKPNYALPDGILGTFGAAGAGCLGSTNVNLTYFGTVYYLTVNPANSNLWAVEYDEGRVLYFSNAQSKANNSGANVVLGQAQVNGSVPSCDAQHLGGNNAGIHYDEDDDTLFVADGANKRVVYWNSAQTLTTGTNITGVIGDPTGSFNCSNNTGSGNATNIGFPYGVFYSNELPGLFLQVADFSGNRIMRYTCATPTFTASVSGSQSVNASSVAPSSVAPSSVAPSSVAAVASSSGAVVASSSGAAVASSSGAIASSSGAVAASSVVVASSSGVVASSSGAVASSSGVAASVSGSGSAPAASVSGSSSVSQSNTPSLSAPPQTPTATPINPPIAGASVVPSECGNGIVELSEECDPGVAVPRTKCCSRVCTNLRVGAVCGKATTRCTKRPKCRKSLNSRGLVCTPGTAKRVGQHCGKGGLFSRKTCKADGSCSK
jgi:hypothetical protein